LSFEFAVDLEVREEIDLGFVVPGAYGNGYYHLIQNSLPNLAIYKELGLTCPILLPAIDGRRFPAALEALTLLLRHLGLTDRVLYSGSEVTGLRVKHAVAPVILPVSAYGIALWRDLYDGLGPAPDETRPANKIYITRGGAGRRRIVNERKVERRMKRAGFRVIDLERLSFLEQARIFRSAGTIVAPHGAGLAHLCFCEPGTRLIEIATKPWLPPFPNICRLAGLEYIPVIPEIVSAEGRSWDMNEFQAPLDRLMRVLGALDAA
jgi:capsular polysaccharide biosynthesis protein